MELSRIPLHLFLGLGTQQIALLELRLKALDAVWAAGRGKELTNPKMEAKLREQEALVIECRHSAEAHHDNATSMQNTIAAMAAEDDPPTADARKAKKTALRKLRSELDVAQKASKASEKASEAAKKEVYKSCTTLRLAPLCEASTSCWTRTTSSGRSILSDLTRNPLTLTLTLNNPNS